MAVDDVADVALDNLLSFPNEPPASGNPPPTFIMSALLASAYGYFGWTTSFAVACCKTDGAKMDAFGAPLPPLLLPPPPEPPDDEEVALSELVRPCPSKPFG